MSFWGIDCSFAFFTFTLEGRFYMLGTKVKEILNEQINKEFYSAYLYLAMSAHLSDMGLYGFSRWCEIQSREEIDHGMILVEYLLKHKEKIDLKNISSPQMNFSSPLEIFEQIYNHEREITRSIDSIAVKSDEECDFATRNFIDWYLKEQIEEEDHTLRIISKLKAFGSEKSSLYLMDKELGQREYHQSFYQ